MSENESPSARDAVYQDLVGTTDEYHAPTILWGTAGWDGEATVEDLGGAGNDGRTLARVTLFRGKKAGDTVKPTLAQGHQVLVQIMGPLFAIPPAGTQVMCVFPEGDTVTPGNGAIIGWAQSSPTQQFKASRAVLDVGATMDLVIKGRTVVLMDHTGDAANSFGAWVGVGPIAGGAIGVYGNDGRGAGFQVSGGVFGAMGTDGAGVPAAKSILQLGASDATISYAGGGYLTITSSKTEVFASTKCNVVGATVGLGTAPTVPVSSVGAPGLPSTCVLMTL